MNIPTLHDVFGLINRLPLEYTVLLFFLTGSVLVLVRDWRVSVGTLVLQYLTLGVALAHLVRIEIAFAKVLVGVFIGLMLYLSARQADWRHRFTVSDRSRHGIRALLGRPSQRGEVLPPGRVFRLMAVLLMAVSAISLAQTYPIPALPNPISIAVYWLLLAGVLLLMLSENPLKIGQGILTALTGFELWYTTLEGSLLVIGLWGGVNLLLTLAIGYLATIQSVMVEEDS